MRVPQLPAESQLYFSPLEICMMRLAPPWPRQLANCCSSTSLICCAVSVIVTRLLPNGCTVKASP